MVAINFKSRFAESVANGTKRQTIRAKRKRPIQVGDYLHLYSGMRTSNCRKLIEELPKCKEVLVITILDYLNPISLQTPFQDDWRELSSEEAEQLAKDDGFDSLYSMIEFFEETHGLPFTGHLIKW